MLWQTVFVSFAVVLILFQLIRGWRLGLMRQLVRLGALMTAYAAALFGGRLILPLARPFVKMPDFVLSILAGAILALLLYAIITSLGTMLFKRTAQQDSRPIRFLYGLSGAALGLFFGAFLVWLIVVGVRSVGAVADAQVKAQAAAQPNRAPPQSLRAIFPRNPQFTENSEETAPLMASLARLKNSLEFGSVGDIVKKTDVVPEKTYEMLGKAGQLFANPENAQRFLNFPGARELTEHPRIVALRNDPEIFELLQQGHLVDLLQNKKIIDAANDSALVEQIKKFDLNAALDYALSRN
jgi:hypothetical protein